MDPHPESPRFPPSPTRVAHLLAAEALKPGDLVIDATAGNGHDTEFLARQVGPAGRVIAFDIQPAAIEATRRRLADLGIGERVRLILAGHESMADHAAPGSVAAVFFNLGYLPGSDHALTTTAPDTLRALDAARHLLKPGGLLSVVCYPGHPGGADEAAAVEARLHDWADSAGWRLARYALPATRRRSPFLLLAANP